MKSPVWGYGRGRNKSKNTNNWKHNSGQAGGLKLRGKKTLNTGCWCCKCENWTDKILEQISNNEISVEIEESLAGDCDSYEWYGTTDSPVFA